jgi:hypothetical protein
MFSEQHSHHLYVQFTMAIACIQRNNTKCAEENVDFCKITLFMYLSCKIYRFVTRQVHIDLTIQVHKQCYVLVL